MSKNNSFQKRWEKIKDDISTRDKTWMTINNKKFKISEYEQIIEQNKKSIFLEKTLSKLPNQGIGSIHFYNELNRKRRYFDNTQFGNIIRFLNHIEEEEVRYRELYVESHESYIREPNKGCYNLLINTLENLNVLYGISNILVTHIDKNVVEYNKVYNNLEDQGYFINEIEKFQIQKLTNISENLNHINDNITNLTKTLKEGLDNINSSIQDVQFETYYVGEKLGDIEMKLWDI